MERSAVYAQFEGEEVAGRIYKHGEQLGDMVDDATRGFLIAKGRFGPPLTDGAQTGTPTTARELDSMSRAELEAEMRATMPFGDVSDDRLREALRMIRGGAMTLEPEADDDKSLDSMTVKELDAIAAADEVPDYPKAGNKADKIAAIEKFRADQPEPQPAPDATAADAGAGAGVGEGNAESIAHEGAEAGKQLGE